MSTATRAATRRADHPDQHDRATLCDEVTRRIIGELEAGRFP
jgi:antirestriction protein ArdC